MKNLIYKDYKLFWGPVTFLYLFFSLLLLVPNWPHFIAFCYIIWIGFVTAFFVSRSNQDTFFSVSLPVRKKDTVLARIYTTAAIEILQILVAIPFAVINNRLYDNSNGAGMNINFAFFGFILVMYAIFNIIFLPGYYKTAYNVGKPMLAAVLGAAVFAIAANVSVMVIPVMKTNFNGLGTDHMAYQLIVLLAAIALFAGLTWLSYKISANRFERVDL
jgi:ABC-2 type transport system permease protein